MKVANVVLAAPFDQTFSYKIPNGITPEIGSIVKVYLRKSIQLGVIVNITPISSIECKYKMKEILDIYNSISLSNELIKFAKWVAKYNMVDLGNIIKMMLINKKNLEYQIDNFCYEDFKVDSKGKPNVILSYLQQKVVKDICEFGLNKYSSHLILGETGSGKTEVYLEIIQQIVNSGSQVLILLPEVLLATQLVKRFKHRLNNCKIAEWNSCLTPKNKSIIWHGVNNHNIDIVVGARSALFLPFNKLRLIVVDEENDNSFKQTEGIIYNARDMAIVRAHIGNFLILLSTATPSAETYHNAQSSKHIMHRLATRHSGVLFPEVTVVDMKETKNTSSGWISNKLKSEIENCLKKNQLSLLFVNRRGYAPITVCYNCGQKLSCPNCQFFLVEHRKKSKMLCHYCGYHKANLIQCNMCDSNKALSTVGIGIEKVEEEVQSAFPNINTITVTSDTVLNFKHASQIVKDIENKKYPIIIGTQMLAKGLNFPNLQLVGIIDSDTSLSNCDLKALERTFQTLYQVAGRSGREKNRGKVILQSHFVNNPIFKFIQEWDYESFIKYELLNRRASSMPPFSRLVIITARSYNEEEVQAFVKFIIQKAPYHKNIEILGPAPSPMYKMNNYYRYRIITRSTKEFDLQRYMELWFQKFRIPKQIKMKIDIDPYNFS